MQEARKTCENARAAGDMVILSSSRDAEKCMRACICACMSACVRACMHMTHGRTHVHTRSVHALWQECAAHALHIHMRCAGQRLRILLANTWRCQGGGGCQCKIAKAADEPIGYPIHCRTDCKCTTSAKAKRRGASAEWECRLQDQSPECKRESARCKMQVPAVRQRESERCKTKVKGEGGSCRPARLQIPVLPEADTSPWCKLI